MKNNEIKSTHTWHLGPLLFQMKLRWDTRMFQLKFIIPTQQSIPVVYSLIIQRTIVQSAFHVDGVLMKNTRENAAVK